MKVMNHFFLKNCNDIYEELLRLLHKLKEKEDAEAVLSWIQIMADWAWRNHCGRYADGNIENIALEIGGNLEKLMNDRNSEGVASNLPKVLNEYRRKVLHIATTFYPVGGHPRIISNWIRNDPDSCHSLLLTNLAGYQIPTWLCTAVSKNGGALITFSSEASLLSKAWWLREIVQSSVDLIVLHHHPNDIVPIVAFASKQCPPVAVLNHADHVFWLGSSIADTVVNIRASGKRLAEKRRYAAQSFVLPIPLDSGPLTVTRGEARQHLNILDGQVMLLSIGSAYKYTPSDTHNFYKTAVKILNQNPAAHLYLIGVEWSEDVKYLGEAKHDRLHLLGVIENHYLYRIAADIYLESYPFGSLTALLEAALVGTCPVLALAPTSQVMASDDLALADIIGNATSEDSYIEKVESLIRIPDKREQIGNEIKERVIAYHSGQKWNGYLQEVYQYLRDKPHEPHRIPNSTCLETKDDLSLSGFHLALCGDRPRLLDVGRRAFPNITLKEIMKLFIVSLKMRHTKVSYTHLYRYWWRELFKLGILRSMRHQYIVSALLRKIPALRLPHA